MRLRYKKTLTEMNGSRFNVHALAEVLTEDDSVFISDLDVFVGERWKDMRQAFKDRDIVPDNTNTYFGEPRDEEAHKRGYND